MEILCFSLDFVEQQLWLVSELPGFLVNKENNGVSKYIWFYLYKPQIAVKFMHSKII
jgi:hypothetical protein